MNERLQQADTIVHTIYTTLFILHCVFVELGGSVDRWGILASPLLCYTRHHHGSLEALRQQSEVITHLLQGWVSTHLWFNLIVIETILHTPSNSNLFLEPTSTELWRLRFLFKETAAVVMRFKAQVWQAIQGYESGTLTTSYTIQCI